MRSTLINHFHFVPFISCMEKVTEIEDKMRADSTSQSKTDLNRNATAGIAASAFMIGLVFPGNAFFLVPIMYNYATHNNSNRPGSILPEQHCQISPYSSSNRPGSILPKQHGQISPYSSSIQRKIEFQPPIPPSVDRESSFFIETERSNPDRTEAANQLGLASGKNDKFFSERHQNPNPTSAARALGLVR